MKHDFLFWQVMSADIGEDAECHAAKLLEVVLLQCPGQVDQVSHNIYDCMTISAISDMLPHLLYSNVHV